MMRFFPVFVALPMLFSGIVSCKQSTSGENSVERNREEAVVAKEELNDRMAAYLMVYFKDDDHSLHFALSKDGRSFT
ncbi:MAG TPA: beta-xylosidase, partial [Zunongwangia profunda]|nr:beta-xylosidase [Zunongwangia profunda]